MKRSEELKIKRQQKIERMQAIIDGAKDGEQVRALNNDEQTEYDRLKGEVESLDGQIDQAEFVEARAVQQPTNEPTTGAQHQRGGQGPQIKRAAKPYSVGKAMRQFAKGGADALDGIEKEQHDELSRGVSSNGLLVPYNYRAANTTTHATSVDVDIDPNLSIIGKEPLWSQMGMTVLPNLQGTIKLGKKTADVAGKVAEEAAISTNTSVPSYVTLAPERFGITDIFSKELLAQENPAVQAAIVADMVVATDRKISAEAYAVALAAATEVAAGAISVAGFNALMGAVDIDGAFAMDRASFFTAKGTELSTGVGRYLAQMGSMNGVGSTYDGVAAYYSTLFDDGVDQQYVLYGAWKEIYLGFWGALEILINPYTYQKNGQIEMTVNRLADLACRNSAAFVKSPDLDVA